MNFRWFLRCEKSICGRSICGPKDCWGGLWAPPANQESGARDFASQPRGHNPSCKTFASISDYTQPYSAIPYQPKRGQSILKKKKPVTASSHPQSAFQTIHPPCGGCNLQSYRILVIFTPHLTMFQLSVWLELLQIDKQLSPYPLTFCCIQCTFKALAHGKDFCHGAITIIMIFNDCTRSLFFGWSQWLPIKKRS